jgi:hypothetical protein
MRTLRGLVGTSNLQGLNGTTNQNNAGTANQNAAFWIPH